MHLVKAIQKHKSVCLSLASKACMLAILVCVPSIRAQVLLVALGRWRCSFSCLCIVKYQWHLRKARRARPPGDRPTFAQPTLKPN
jgi:hypothetical protein